MYNNTVQYAHENDFMIFRIYFQIILLFMGLNWRSFLREIEMRHELMPSNRFLSKNKSTKKGIVNSLITSIFKSQHCNQFHIQRNDSWGDSNIKKITVFYNFIIWRMISFQCACNVYKQRTVIKFSNSNDLFALDLMVFISIE